MATTTDVQAGVQMIALDQIRTDRNVRQQVDAAARRGQASATGFR